VRSMTSAPATVLAELDAIGRVATALVGLVVPTLALLASKSNRETLSRWHVPAFRS